MEDQKKNVETIKKLDFTEYKEGQYLVLVDGKVIKKGWAVDKMIARVRKLYPSKIPFIFRIQAKGPLGV